MERDYVAAALGGDTTCLTLSATSTPTKVGPAPSRFASPVHFPVKWGLEVLIWAALICLRCGMSFTRTSARPNFTKTGPWPGALFCLWPLLPHPGRPTRCLQGALQPGRDPLRSLGLRRCSAVRPYRKKSILPRISWGVGLQLRHAGLRSALFLLPELGNVPSPP